MLQHPSRQHLLEIQLSEDKKRVDASSAVLGSEELFMIMTKPCSIYRSSRSQLKARVYNRTGLLCNPLYSFPHPTPTSLVPAPRPVSISLPRPLHFVRFIGIFGDYSHYFIKQYIGGAVLCRRSGAAVSEGERSTAE